MQRPRRRGRQTLDVARGARARGQRKRREEPVSGRERGRAEEEEEKDGWKEGWERGEALSRL